MISDDLKKHPNVLNLYRSRVKLQKRGAEMVGPCPFHSEKTGSFTVSQKEGKWLHHCFGCGASGDVFSFVQKLDNCGFKQAQEIVEKFCGVHDKEAAEKIFQPISKEQPKRVFTLAEYKKLEDALENNTFVQNWLQVERGIGMDAARKLHFGFVPKLPFNSDSDVADKGWVALPVVEENKVVAVELRSIVKKEVRKFPNMKTTGLLGGHLVDPLNPAFVVEGGFDAAIMVQAGYTACSIPNAAFNPTPEAVELLKQAEYVVLAGDGDAPGVAAMKRLHSALHDGAVRIGWQQGCKDASDAYKVAQRSGVDGFKRLVDGLVENARQNPLEGIYSVQHSLLHSEHGKLVEHPDRLRFPWPTVDSMAIIMPGTVTTVFSTESGQGKSSWVLQATIHGARQCGEVVLNYQAELTTHQIDTLFTSHLLHKDRLNLEQEDYRKAGRLLGQDFRYYIGRDTSLTSMDQVLDLIESGIKHFHPTVVVLDNLHFLCRGTGKDVYKEQAAAMQRIVNLAAANSLKFIVVHQARKADQQHKGKTNHISDLDGTKAIQNDSATVFSIHRDEIKPDKNGGASAENEYSPLTQIAVKKFRDKGPGLSYTTLMFNGKIATFSEITLDKPFESKGEDGLF